MFKPIQVPDAERLGQLVSAKAEPAVKSCTSEVPLGAPDLRVCGSSSHSPLFPLVFSEGGIDAQLGHAHPTSWQGPVVQGVKEARTALSDVIEELSKSNGPLKSKGAKVLRKFAEQIEAMCSRVSPDVPQALALDNEIVSQFKPLGEKLRGLQKDNLLQARNGSPEGGAESAVQKLDAGFRNLINAVRAEVGRIRADMLKAQYRRAQANIKGKIPEGL